MAGVLVRGSVSQYRENIGFLTLFLQAASAHRALEEQEHVPTSLHWWLGEPVPVVTFDLTCNLIVIYSNLYFNSLHVLWCFLILIFLKSETRKYV